MSERNKKSNRELAVEMSVAGMNMKEVSASLGIPYSTVYGWLRASKPGGNGSNADRHLCRTCMYRAGSYERNAGGVNCNYCDIVKHSRGCKPEECTVYVRGPMARRRKRGRRGEV